MARRRSTRARGWAGCGCPSGSRKISTKGRGRGWVCQSTSYKRNKRGGRFKPFVKATCR